MTAGFDIRAIPGLEGYGASADGRIWSRWKRRRRELTHAWREIAQAKKKASEYRLVHIGPARNQKTYLVHRLVVAAFIGPIPDGMVVDHLDCDKSNNTPINLEIVTVQENERRALVNGRKFKGDQHPNAKYIEDQIREIKCAYVPGVTTQKYLSEKFGVGLPTVIQVLSGRQWSHV